MSDLATQLSLPKSTTHRLIATLVGAGLAEQDASTHKYRAAVRLLEWADAVRSRIGARDVVHSFLVRLASETRETANLGVLRDESVVYLDKVGSGEPYTIDIRIGTAMPAHCTALGKSIIAFLPDEEIQRRVELLTLVKRTPRSVMSRRLLLRQLREVRALGFARDDGEVLEDICCIAAPVFDADHRPIAAVSVSSPRSRFLGKQEAMSVIVRETAASLSEALRYADRSEIRA